MKKHIKVQAAVLEKFTKVLVTVLEQTHRSANFGAYGRSFTASNGITLASNQNPARDTDDKKVIWLRGSKLKGDKYSFACTKAEWPAIQAAIVEYNNYNFPTPYVVHVYTPRPAASCSVIIG
jgi:hypothetical protein